MTDKPPPRLLLPIGHDLGAHFADPESDPVFRVRVGRTIVSLEAPDYVVWSLAHGVADQDEERSRVNVVIAALARGLDDPEPIIDRLIEWSLLYDVGLGTNESFDFSLVFRPVPLMLALGTSVDEPEVFNVGVAGETVVRTTQPVYDLYIWAHLEENLWAACEAAAAIAIERGEHSAERTDPRLLMEYFLLSAHDFLSTSSMYFDIERERPDTTSAVVDAEGGAL